MASMAQAFSPHPAGIQHPGVAMGHPMAPGQPHPGAQPGPGMPQHMQMGVSGPGPQMVQPGAMLGVGLPPGAVPGPNAHALQHLNPTGPGQLFHQQQQPAQMAFANPQLQQQMQQQLIQQQQQQRVAQQRMMQQQMGAAGMPMNIPNGMNPALAMQQFQRMQAAGNMRPVALPQHLQQQQAQLGMEAQQAAHAQQQQQMLQHQHVLQQQAANAAAAQANSNVGGPGPMNQQQMQSMQNLMAAQQAQQQAQQNQQQAQAAQQQAQQQAQQNQQQQAAAQQQQQQQQSQPQGQAPPVQASPAQPPTSQPGPNSQQAQQHAQHQQAQQQQAQQQQAQQQQQQHQQAQNQMQVQNQAQAQAHAQAQQAAAVAMMQQQQRPIKGHCILKLVQFGDHLSDFRGTKSSNDLSYWTSFVETFFTPRGVLRHSVLLADENTNKQYEITYPALPRYFYTHFESGIENMQLMIRKAKEKELAHNCHFIESNESSFIYWFENGSQLVAHGQLKAQFDASQKIELLDFTTTRHEEYVPRTKVIEFARPTHDWNKEWRNANALPPSGDSKMSPEMNKKGKARPMKSPANPPPEPEVPESRVKLNMGITPAVFRFLELAEVIGQMNPLFHFAHLNPVLKPYAALDNYVVNVVNQTPFGPGGMGAPGGMIAGGGMGMQGPMPGGPLVGLPPGALQQQGAGPPQMQGQQQQQQGGGMPLNLPSGVRTPQMVHQFQNMGASPSAAHLGLPMQDGVSAAAMAMGGPPGGLGVIGGSPALGHMAAPPMVAQLSQQGTSSSGPSANTSPNVSGKRRRGSVKVEGGDVGDVPNGVGAGAGTSLAGQGGPRVKPSPKIGGKRQKPNP